MDDRPGPTFEWDPQKAASNVRKHRGVSFEEALTAFADPLSVTVADPDNEEGEQRWLLIGTSARGRAIVVVHAERGENIRIISARNATKHERREYEEG